MRMCVVVFLAMCHVFNCSKPHCYCRLPRFVRLYWTWAARPPKSWSHCLPRRCPQIQPEVPAVVVWLRVGGQRPSAAAHNRPNAACRADLRDAHGNIGSRGLSGTRPSAALPHMGNESASGLECRGGMPCVCGQSGLMDNHAVLTARLYLCAYVHQLTQTSVYTMSCTPRNTGLGWR